MISIFFSWYLIPLNWNICYLWKISINWWWVNSTVAKRWPIVINSYPYDIFSISRYFGRAVFISEIYIYFNEGCIGFPCKNGGKCTETENAGFVCTCTEGWSGSTCEFLGGKIYKSQTILLPWLDFHYIYFHGTVATRKSCIL